MILDLRYSSSWRSKSGSHRSRPARSHWRSKWRWLDVLNLIGGILNSHWGSCKLLWLFHNWGAILWNFRVHRIMHRWRLDCLNWWLIYLWIESLSLRLRNWSMRWYNNSLFDWRRSDNLMHRLLLNLILWLYLILLLHLRNRFLYLSIGRIECR